MDVVLLSRLQFAFTIMFHYLFPPLTIGMGVVLVYLDGMFLRTGDELYHQAARFWTKIFALNFAIGVATGIVMEFEFGTNWAVYSRFVGDVFGSALAAEGIFAFFLESGFLAVLVFGWDRVGPRMHFFSTLMVALGSIFSSVWIVVANSWQQTPAGHHVVQMTRDGAPWFVDGQPVLRAEIVDFWSLVFNPSSINRLVHVWIGSFILGAFFIMSISAWYVLKRRHLAFARRSFTGALILGTLSSLAMLASGHFQARAVAEQQPAKLAAFEGHYRTGKAGLSLFGIPDPENERIDFNLSIPGGLSFLVHDDFDAPVTGLDRFRPEHRPPVTIPFVSYHLMIGLGVAFILLTLVACYLLLRGKLFDSRPMMWIFVFAVLGAFVANQVGWVAAEVGRQPWVVHPGVERDATGGLVLDDAGFARYVTTEITLAGGTTERRIAGLLTREGVSEVIRADHVLGSIVMFGLLYALLFALWIFLLNRKIQGGPGDVRKPRDERQGLLGAAGSIVDHEESMTGSAEG